MIPVRVIDGTTNATLPGVTVLLLNDAGNTTTAGGITDSDGIVALEEPGVYRFHMLGYARPDVRIDLSTTVALQPVNYGIDEFEVVGHHRPKWPLLLLAVILISDP